jgi:TonB family protein
MNIPGRSVLTLASLLVAYPLAYPLCYAKDLDNVTSEALISRARTIETWDAGSPPISLQAEVQVRDAAGKLATGSYTLDWASPAQLREEIRFNGYSRLRVGGTQGYWQLRSVDYEPDFIVQLDNLLHIKGVLTVKPEETIGKIQDREKDGVRQQCVEIKYPKFANFNDRRMCFDATDGTLRDIEYLTHQHLEVPDVSRVEYNSFARFGPMFIPQDVQAFQGKRVIMAVKIVKLSPLSDPNGAMFAQPANAQFWSACEGVQRAELINRVQPVYPHEARLKEEGGRVAFYFVIEEDGSVSRLLLTRSAGSELDAAAAAAIRQYRYKPATCGSKPIRIESSVSFEFSTQH